MNETIFERIIKGEIPTKKVHETDNVLAFYDVAPQAPTHILIVPKTHMDNVADAKDSDEAVLGKLLLAARDIAKKLGLEKDGYRLVINNGAGVGQTVFHLHVHLLAGRQFNWPPG
jgi:histidine triad (HIT) family protein